MTWTEVLTLLTPLLLVIGIVAGYFSLRTSLARSAIKISNQLRDDLSKENDVLTGRVERLEKENRRLSRALQLVTALLKRALGIELQIDENVIMLRSKDGTLTTQYLNLEEEKEIS